MDTITNNKIDGDIPGTVHGGGTTTTGYHGSAFRCDKTSDTYIDFGDTKRNECWGDPSNCPSGFTYLFWFKPVDLESAGTTGFIMDNGGGTRASWGISLYIRSGYLYAAATTKTEQWWNTGAGHGVPISTNVWYHIFLVWDYTNGLRLYRDGGAWNAIYSRSSRTPISTTAFNHFCICKPSNSVQNQFLGDLYMDELIFMDATVDLNFAIAHMQSYRNYDTTEDCGADTTPGPRSLRCVQAMWFAVGCLTSGEGFPMVESEATYWMALPKIWDIRYDHLLYRSRSDANAAAYQSHCIGNVHDVALQSNGASSNCSSEYSVNYACDYALTAGNEWASSGEGVGVWINITFDAVYVVDNVRLKQRLDRAEQNKGLTFLFSDGLKYSVTTFQRPGLTNYDWDTFHLPSQVTTAWMQIYVDSIYTKAYNGFEQIQVFKSSEPCLVGLCKNGGTCRWNKIQKYICYCKEGYSGRNCENFQEVSREMFSYMYTEDSFLAGSSFFSEIIFLDLECAQMCINNVECLSYNVYTDSNGKLTCDLNSNSPGLDIGLNLSFRSKSTFYYFKLPEDCESVQGPDGVYTIQPRSTQLVVKVKCEGGWTVIARRTSRDLLFNQTWHAYKYGFGSVSGDHWLGNEYIHALTNQASYSIRIEETNINDDYFFANYDKFLVGSEEEKYKLRQWSGYYGNLASSYVQTNVGMYFTTLDRDNDRASYNCANEARMGGGWWYNSCTDVSITSHYPLDNGTCARSNSMFCMRDHGIQNGGIDKTLLVAATMKIRKA